jgi:hypothetical protein
MENLSMRSSHERVKPGRFPHTSSYALDTTVINNLSLL